MDISKFLSKKNILISVIVFVLIIALIFALFFRDKKEEPDPSSGESPYKCVFVRNPAGELSAVLDDGKIAIIGNINNADIIQSGYVSTKLNVNTINNGSIKITSVNSIKNNYNIALKSDYENVHTNYAKHWLDSFLYNGKASSISEYKINSVDIISKENEGKITISIKFDVKPSEVDTMYKNIGEDGFVRGLERKLSIYGTQNLWYTLEESKDIMFSEQEQIFNPKTDAFTPNENQTIIFGDSDYTYYQEFTYPSADNKSNYKASVYSFKNSSKQKKLLISNVDKTRFYYSHSTNDKVIFSSVLFDGGSPKENTNLYYVNKAEQKMYNIDIDSLVLTKVGNTVYVVNNLKTLYSVDLSSNKATKVCDLPMNISQFKSALRCYVKDDVITLLIGDDKVNCIEIDLKAKTAKTVLPIKEIKQ